jgi:hypothetical protein
MASVAVVVCDKDFVATDLRGHKQSRKHCQSTVGRRERTAPARDRAFAIAASTDGRTANADHNDQVR